MGDWRILVIDDEAMSSNGPGIRHDKYLGLTRTRYDRKSFLVDFAQDADDAREKLSIDDYDMVLLDVILDGWGRDPDGTVFRELLTRADRRCAVGLVSSAWDQTSIPRVRNILNEHPEINIPLMFVLRDFEAGASEALGALGVQIVSYVRKRRHAHWLDLGENDPLRILHLSDLHFGASDADEFFNDELVETLSSHVKSNFPGMPHLIAITGDIGNTGHPDDYAKALTWLRAFADEFEISLPNPRVLLIPGNHDFSITLAAAASLQLNGHDKPPVARTPGEHDNRLTAYAMQPFIEFARQATTVYDTCTQSPTGGWVSIAFAEYGIVFSGHNTSKSCASNFWPTRTLDTGDLYCQKKHLEPFARKIGNGQLLHVALAHHSPISTPEVHQPVDDTSRAKFISNFLDKQCAPRLILHGHQHMRKATLIDDYQCLVVCAPTPSKQAGARAPDSPRGVNLLTLHRECSTIKRIDVASITKDQNKWETKPIQGRANYQFNP